MFLGLTGSVYCLGCAPDEVVPLIEDKLSEFKTEEQLQNAVVQHMFKLMVGDVTADLEEAVKTATTWAQKVDACVRTLLGRVSHSAQYARAFIEAALARIYRLRGYVAPARALRSQLVLLRAVTAHTTAAPLALQQHSQKPIAVYQLSAPLAHAASDIRCASIINEYLDPTILDDFEKRNLCDAYLVNPNSFMAVDDD